MHAIRHGRKSKVTSVTSVIESTPVTGGTVPLWEGSLLNSQTVVDNTGICFLANFITDIYGGAATAAEFIKPNNPFMTRGLNLVQEMGLSFIRSPFNPNNAGVVEAARICGVLGLKVVWLPIEESSTQPTGVDNATVTARINTIAQKYAAMTKGIEGLNEPNHNRGHSTTVVETTPGWQDPTLARQEAIWNAVQDATTRTDPVTGATYTNKARLAHVEVYGPSLHDQASAKSQSLPVAERHYQLLFNARTAAGKGIKDFMGRVVGGVKQPGMIGMHRYPSGGTPMTNYAERVGYMTDAAGTGQKRFFTEFGYTNVTQNTGAGQRIPAVNAGPYFGRAVLEFAVKGEPLTWYELLDDEEWVLVNGVKERTFKAIEGNFGAVKVQNELPEHQDPATWALKQGGADLKALLAELKDTAAGASTYQPLVPRLQVTAAPEVKSFVTGKKDGTWLLHLYRDVRTWDNSTHTSLLPVATTNVQIVDPQGSRTVAVGASRVSYPVRPAL